MNAANIDSSRAIDLSALAAAAKAPKTPAGPAGGTYVVEADEATFEQAMSKSMQHPIVLEFYSPRADAQQMSDDLAALANAAAGKYLLVRLNVDQAPGIVQALGIQGVPMIVGALGGQLAPLAQGIKTKQELAALIEQLLKAAVGNGIIGRAQAVPGTSSPDAPAAGPDPRFVAADSAMEEGDYARAVEEFDKILAATPGDSEAIAGKAGAELLVRLAGKGAQAVADAVRADPDNVDAQLDAADLELASGQPETAFARLVQVVRDTAGEDRNRVRIRLLALFETVGNSDPAVLKARRDLMTALF